MESYTSPKIELRKHSLSGKGVFAKDKIKKGEILVDFRGGPGEFINDDKAEELWNKGNDHMIQVDDNLYFAAATPKDLEVGDFINHSCEPNSGIKKKLQIVAMKDIKPGEEITFDYAMSEASDYSFLCACGAKKCRKKVTGNDWQIKELQKRYKGYFSDYIQKKIKALAKKKKKKI